MGWCKRPRNRSSKPGAQAFSRTTPLPTQAISWVHGNAATSIDEGGGPAGSGAGSATASPGWAGSRPIQRMVRTDTPVSLAIYSCGTPDASSNWISRRFPSVYMDSSSPGEPEAALPAREDRESWPFS